MPEEQLAEIVFSNPVAQRATHGDATLEEATGKVKEIYEEIKSQLGIDFIPNLYKAMAPKPDYLEASRNLDAVSIQ